MKIKILKNWMGCNFGKLQPFEFIEGREYSVVDDIKDFREGTCIDSRLAEIALYKKYAVAVSGGNIPPVIENREKKVIEPAEIKKEKPVIKKIKRPGRKKQVAKPIRNKRKVKK